MPVFEFRCLGCHRKFATLIGMIADSGDVKCPHCGSADVAKLVSRFARVRNEDDRIDAIADRLETMGDTEDTASMRELVRDMGKAMDEDLSDEMEEMFEADMEGKLEDEF